MALLHATQLAHATVFTGAGARQSLYTVPTGFRIVLRSVAIVNMASTAQGFFLYLPDPNEIWFHSLGFAHSTTDSFELRPWFVASEGQVISAAAFTSPGVNVLLSGSIYTI